MPLLIFCIQFKEFIQYTIHSTPCSHIYTHVYYVPNGYDGHNIHIELSFMGHTNTKIFAIFLLFVPFPSEEEYILLFYSYAVGKTLGRCDMNFHATIIFIFFFVVAVVPLEIIFIICMFIKT